jgi:hypothetical protein
MPGQTLYLTTYTYNSNENKFQYVSLADEQWNTNDNKPVWTYLLPIIRKSIKHKFKQIKLYEDSEVYPLKEPQIILLFLESKELTNPIFFDKLAKGGGADLRPHVTPEDRNEKIENGKIYHPIITIAEPDITYLYSEEKDAEGQGQWNGLIYSCLNLDKRFKILDSSIWHRYVPVDPYYYFCEDGDKEVKKVGFSDIFIEVLGDIATYHRQGLYYTNASVISLEFQMRMLLHSYVGKFGDKGHSEVVTPFKFHSERQMAMKVKKEIAFLLEDWGEKGNNLLRALNWRFLIVDDQARSQLSFIREEFAKSHKKLTKENLILQPLTKLYEENHLPVKEYISIHAKNRQSEYNIIDDAVSAISKFTFDIVFLDYLLGKNLTTQEREYGHEFLLKLLEDNRLDYPLFKRDFLGKYWVFPISSYPHALTDKLTQLGINYIHEIWYIAQGADPVSVPQLYAYNLLRFIKQKVGKFFLYPNALKRLINQIPMHENVDSKLWMNVLSEIIKNGKTRLNLLNKEQTDDNSSLFVRSIKVYIKNHRRTVIDPMFNSIELILEMLREEYVNRGEEEIRKSLNLLMARYAQFQEGLNPLKARIERILNYNHQLAEKIIADSIKTGSSQLSLAGLKLKSIPEKLREARQIEQLELNGNYLSDLPSYFKELSKLHFLDLSNNKFEKFPAVLADMKNLGELDFSGNALKIKGIKPHVHSNIEIIEMHRLSLESAYRQNMKLLKKAKKVSITDATLNNIIELLRQISPIPSNRLAIYFSLLQSRSALLEDWEIIGFVKDEEFEKEKQRIIRGFNILINRLEEAIIYP